jgi:heme oxygenase
MTRRGGRSRAQEAGVCLAPDRKTSVFGNSLVATAITFAECVHLRTAAFAAPDGLTYLVAVQTPGACMYLTSQRRFKAEAPREDLLTALRAQTTTQHKDLEHALDLLAEPLSRERFLHVLQRFFGFHAVWEAGVLRHPSLRAFHVARCRTPLLRADLLALGRTADEIDALPTCEPARTLTADAGACLGSLYVMEGSTLGGQVISRALAGAPWAPPGGLRSFNPYGAETGARWKEFRAFAERTGQMHSREAIIDGARRTFELLKEWTA